MASQQGPPSRPWFRLATMARPPQPDQPPPPVNVVAPPLPKDPHPTPPLQPSSPPKTVENTSPPSPLALPSPQLNSYSAPQYDQKSVLLQETKEKKSNPRDTHYPIKKPQLTSNKHQDSEDLLGMRRIITIAGENKGAIMDLSPFGNNMKKDNPAASSDDKSETNSDGKPKAKNKNRKSKSRLMSTTAVMNSNVQGVNNSILYNCSTTHHDVGVHLSLSRNPSGGPGFLLKDHIK